MELSQVRFAKSGDLYIAYRVEGEGPFDLAVVIGSRVADHADEGEVLVLGTVRDLVAGSGIVFEPRGARDLKGLGEWPLFAVVTA